MHCHIASGQWAVEVLQHIATLLRASGHGSLVLHRHRATGSRHWKCCNAPAHHVRAVKSGDRAKHRHAALRQ